MGMAWRYVLHQPGNFDDPVLERPPWSTDVEEALPVERKGPLTWVETRGIEPRTSCLQIADHHSCGVSTVLEPRSQSGLTHPILGCITGMVMARVLDLWLLWSVDVEQVKRNELERSAWGWKLCLRERTEGRVSVRTIPIGPWVSVRDRSLIVHRREGQP